MIKKNLKFIIPALILFVALLFYFVTINYTTIYVDENYAEENYLSLNDLVLRDGNNEKVGLFPSTGEADFISNYQEPKFHTSKNLMVGDSFEDFIKAYGDYYSNSIHCVSYDNDSDDFSTYNSQMYYNLKVKDFYDTYIKNGDIDLENNELTFDFYAYIYGNKIAFSEKIQDDVRHTRYSSFWPEGGIFNPRLQRYYLSFSFVMIDGEYVLDYLSSNHYAY